MRLHLYTGTEVTVLLGAMYWAVLFPQDKPRTIGGKLSSQNFEIVGIALASSEVEDLERVLGRRTFPDTPSPDREGVQSCYCSPGNDRTVLQFDTWIGTVVEFHFFQGSRRLVSRCTKSRRISRSLATASGVRLGMSRREAIALLGKPANSGEDLLEYELDYNRSPTPEELKQSRDAFVEPPALINIYGYIKLSFRNKRVVRVDALRNKD